MENLIFGDDEVIIMTDEIRVNKQGDVCFPVIYSLLNYNCGGLIPFSKLKEFEESEDYKISFFYNKIEKARGIRDSIKL